MDKRRGSGLDGSGFLAIEMFFQYSLALVGLLCGYLGRILLLDDITVFVMFQKLHVRIRFRVEILAVDFGVGFFTMLSVAW